MSEEVVFPLELLRQYIASDNEYLLNEIIARKHTFLLQKYNIFSPPNFPPPVEFNVHQAMNSPVFCIGLKEPGVYYVFLENKDGFEFYNPARTFTMLCCTPRNFVHSFWSYDSFLTTNNNILFITTAIEKTKHFTEIKLLPGVTTNFLMQKWWEALGFVYN